MFPHLAFVCQRASCVPFRSPARPPSWGPLPRPQPEEERKTICLSSLWGAGTSATPSEVETSGGRGDSRVPIAQQDRAEPGGGGRRQSCWQQARLSTSLPAQQHLVHEAGHKLKARSLSPSLLPWASPPPPSPLLLCPSLGMS